MQQQHHNGLHFSKLFKGYSYISPKALEWLKQQDRKKQKPKSISRARISFKLGQVDRPEAHIEQQQVAAAAKRQQQLPARVSGARAVPMKDVLTLDDFIDVNQLDNDRPPSNLTNLSSDGPRSLVAFTIGDGEDLASAVRSASVSNTRPERLVVVKRKPSLELLYERHANNQTANPADGQTTKQHSSASHSTANQHLFRTGAIRFDSNCDFFKVYHLAHPLNSKKDLLGEGAYSICKRCVHKETGKEYAVKVMRRCPETSREIDMLTRCQGHPNIVRLHRVFQDQFNSYLVCELLKGGELLARLQKKRHFMSEPEIRRLFKSLVSSVYYLHSQRIVHRDLKPENLLFCDSTPSSDLKLIDFGFARELPEPSSGYSMKSPCITLDYCAPEVLEQAMIKDSPNSIDEGISTASSSGSAMSSKCSTDGYDESCDLWSMGVILYAMFSGRLPFRDSATSKPLGPINVSDSKRNLINFGGPRWANISQAPKDLIRGLLEPNPIKRLTIEQLAQNEWIVDNEGEEDDEGGDSTICAANNHDEDHRVKRLRLPDDGMKQSATNISNHQGVAGSADNKWMNRFVEVYQPDKSNLRVTFKAYYYYYCC